jgi:hypothetical protein
VHLPAWAPPALFRVTENGTIAIFLAFGEKNQFLFAKILAV